MIGFGIFLVCQPMPRRGVESTHGRKACKQCNCSFVSCCNMSQLSSCRHCSPAKACLWFGFVQARETSWSQAPCPMSTTSLIWATSSGVSWVLTCTPDTAAAEATTASMCVAQMSMALPPKLRYICKKTLHTLSMRQSCHMQPGLRISHSAYIRDACVCGAHMSPTLQRPRQDIAYLYFNDA